MKEATEIIGEATADNYIRELTENAENETAFYAGRCFHDFEKVKLSVEWKILEAVPSYESPAALIPKGGAKILGGISIGNGVAALKNAFVIPEALMQESAMAFAFAAAMGDYGSNLSLEASWESLKENFSKMMESTKGGGGSNLGNYEFKKGIDEDLRDGKGNFEEKWGKIFNFVS